MKGAISIGSHYAEEYELWLSEGAKNFIFFEPIKSTYEKMVKILPKSDNITTYNMAVGNKTGFVDMHVETVHQGKSCSILEPLKHLTQYPDIEFTHTEEVRIVRLDDVDFDNNLYDHLHIDTQGYEMEVLKGAEESLDYINTIQVEVYKEELYKGCAKMWDVLKFLEDKGFKVTQVVMRGLTWGDAYLKKKQ